MKKRVNVTDVKDLITPAEAARLRQVTRATLSYLVKKKRFETYEIGGRIFLRRSEVLKYVPAKGGRSSRKSVSDKRGRKKR
jgi:excisionase family DNA binding protein